MINAKFMNSVRSKKIKATKSKIWNKKFNLGRIAEKLLDHLAGALEDGYILARTFSDKRGTFIAARDEFEEEMEWFRKQAEKRRLVYELKRRRLIEEEKIGKRVLYFLTEKGSAAITRYEILNCDKCIPENRVCVVVFDIPESQKHVRELFRRFLKEAGFKYLQQSVWITNKNVVERLRVFIHSIQAEQWVNIFLADAIIMQPSKSRKPAIYYRLAKVS